MTSSVDLAPVLNFLDELARNNNKAWFEAHRPAYDTARSAFEQLIEEVIDEFRVLDHLQGLTAKECTARIYRDIRFSKDKSPYKKAMGAVVAPGGWRSTSLVGYYIHIEPHGQSMVAGGMHEPTPRQLDRFRSAVASDAAEFMALTSARTFVDTFGAVEGDRLKTAPRGYDPAHPQIALLQLKQVLVARRFADAEVTASGFVGQVLVTCRAMRPFLEYLQGIMGEAGAA